MSIIAPMSLDFAECDRRAWREIRSMTGGSIPAATPPAFTAVRFVRCTPLGPPMFHSSRLARRPAAQVGGLTRPRFDPRKGSMIFIDAIEIYECLASYLVGLDPFLCNQLIGFRFSEFAIAAPVLKLDEPPPFVVVVVSHGSYRCFDDH